MKSEILSALLLCLCAGAYAQGTASRMQFSPSPLRGTVEVATVQEDLFPELVTLEMPAPAPGTERAALKALRDEITAHPQIQPGFPSTAYKTTTVQGVTLGRNFVGNATSNGVPNDNDMAISNAEKVISAINSNFYVYDGNGAQQYSISLNTFATSLGIPAFKFDPRVMYDQDADRFILVFLAGSDSTATDIIVAFSQTNDPAGAWNLYSFPGNPLHNNCWSDYPMMSITDDELFITVNNVLQDVSWQTGFVQTLVWQIGKHEGYAGDSLPNQMWYNVMYGGKPIRNLCPVKGGADILGPNQYFVSDRNFATTNDSIFIVEITDTLNAPGVQLLVDMQQTNVPYGFPPRGKQGFNHYLETNDARILSAFLDNDQIQFAGNSVNPATGLAGIYHGTIQGVSGTRTVTGTVVGDSLLDFGYPNLCYAGMASGTGEAVLSFEYTSVDSFAGCMAIWYDGQGGYSSPTQVKKGANYINQQTSVYERWGDYSGSQRKWTEPGMVWMAADWGNSQRRHATWIAELYPPFITARPEPAAASGLNLTTWPNPAQDQVTVGFALPEARRVEIRLTDALGRQTHLLLQDRIRPGTHEFRFSTADLPAGSYVLQVQDETGQVAVRKIIVVQ